MDNHLVIAEQAWAKEVSLGSVEITEVPVEGADPNDVASGTSTNTQFAAILGLAALKRLDVIIDNQNNVIYLRLKKTPLLPYQHNRLGAIFAPQDSKGTNFIARVTAGSPAYEAGIRNGDILLNRDANGTFEQPAGTKINFTLKRDDKIFTTTAVLRNILPPDSTKN
jgi:S1-C subfamily serine protease